MSSLRWISSLIAIILPTLLYAKQIPVVVDQRVYPETTRLEALGFSLHARSAEYLIGTLPKAALEQPAEGITPLPGVSSDFSGVYQVDKRSLKSAANLISELQVITDLGTSLLIYADADLLAALCSEKIHFRAIPALGRPFKTVTQPILETDDIYPFVGVILDQISPTSYQNYLQTLQNYGTRNTYNSQCDSAAIWIQQQFQTMGLPAWRDSFQIGGFTRYSALAQRTGTVYPERVLYLIAHYDATAGLPIGPEATAPGADDDASGAALVLECARVISQFTFQNTIRFAIFAGNEQGLLGSEHYALQLPIPGETYLGCLDADMVGYSGTDPWPPDLVIYTDNNPASITIANKVGEAVSVFLPNFLQSVIHQDASMVYADHGPFWDAGIAAVLAMEDEVWGPDLNPRYHSPTDLIQYMDVQYALHSTEALLAAVADLALPNAVMQPWLTAGGGTIDDYIGNHNGQIEYGEGLHITLAIVNAGGAAAPAVNVTLSEADPYITFSDWQENYGTIPAQDTVSIPNAFTASVALNVPDLHQFDITVNMASGSNLWHSTLQLVAHAPLIILQELLVDDAGGGNNNGRLEPGETANLKIKLLNNGSYQAQNLTANLTGASPYVTINTTSNSYGTLLPDSSAQRNYSVTASATAPQYSVANFTLSYQAIGNWTAQQDFSISVGMPVYLPTGPDNYGYQAFDRDDDPFGPIYSWIEINPNQGGQGTLLDFTADDQTLFVNLPFTFTYYGRDYTELSICSNGWVACGHRTNTDYSNTTIPYSAGPAAMISPYWDDLSPQTDGDICTYFNAPLGKFIVEYYRVKDYSPSGDHHTFEVIFYDPAVYPTLTGDGDILIQYGQVDNTASCTVGIENHDQNDGIQYLYNAVYDSTAATIGQGKAILFTTGYSLPNVDVTLTPINPPIQIPAQGGSFQYNINIHNLETTTLTMDIWIMMKLLPNGPWTGPYLNATRTLPGGANPTRLRTQTIAGSLLAGTYLYEGRVGAYPDTIWSYSNFQFVKLASGEGLWMEGYVNSGEDYEEFAVGVTRASPLPTEFALGQNYPNPFNSSTVIPLELPQRSKVKLEVFNLKGQRVGNVYEGVENAGYTKVYYDASRLASGIYFCKVSAEGLEREGKFSGVSKMVLLK